MIERSQPEEPEKFLSDNALRDLVDSLINFYHGPQDPLHFSKVETTFEDRELTVKRYSIDPSELPQDDELGPLQPCTFHQLRLVKVINEDPRLQSRRIRYVVYSSVSIAEGFGVFEGERTETWNHKRGGWEMATNRDTDTFMMQLIQMGEEREPTNEDAQVLREIATHCMVDGSLE